MERILKCGRVDALNECAFALDLSVSGDAATKNEKMEEMFVEFLEQVQEHNPGIEKFEIASLMMDATAKVML